MKAPEISDSKKPSPSLGRMERERKRMGNWLLRDQFVEAGT